MRQLTNSRTLTRLVLALVGCLSLLFSQVPVSVLADTLTTNQHDTFKLNINYFNTERDSGTCSGSISNIVNIDTANGHAQAAFEFFTASGYSAAQAAGLVGNLMQESGEGIAPDATSSDGMNAYGIAQWQGGRKTNLKTWVSAQGGDYTTFEWQLKFIIHELNTSESAAKAKIKATDTPKEAADAVMTYYERPAAAYAEPQKRESYAETVYAKFGSTTPTTPDATVDTGSDCTTTDSSSPDCVAASGTIKILCEAKKYDPVSYSEVFLAGHQGGAAWHKTCPTIDASCILDCSGLVTVATYDAFGNKGSWTTATIVGDSQNWKRIKLSEVGPGDLIMPNSGHVEIVDHIKGSTVYTFGAHTSHVPQPQQVGPSSFAVASSNVYLRYVGTGI